MDANETSHAGWHIRTVTGFDNPEGWKPGDPDTYVVRGVAEFPPFDPEAENWASTDPLTAESRPFTNMALTRRFHAEVEVKLRELIDARRPGEGW